MITMSPDLELAYWEHEHRRLVASVARDALAREAGQKAPSLRAITARFLIAFALKLERAAYALDGLSLPQRRRSFGR